MIENNKHEETNNQQRATTANSIVEDLRKAGIRADREGWISDEEMQTEYNK